MNIKEKLNEIYKLKPGWFDGQGNVPDRTDLNWLESQIKLFYPKDLVAPYFCPTPEGRLLLEWSINDEDISLEINFKTRIGTWHRLNLKSDAEIYTQLDLNNPADWDWLVEQIECF